MSCPDCTSGNFLPGEPTGVLSTQGAYLAAGATQPSKRAVILLTDVFGLPLNNCKIIADHFAKELDCDVWTVDYFAGRPIMPLTKLKAMERAGGHLSTWDWIRFFLFDLLPHIPAFFASRPSVADARILEFIKVIRKEKKYEKIGAVGYCYGGSAAFRIGVTDHVQSIVIFHPGPFTVDFAKTIKAPAFWGCAQEDQFVSQKLIDETEAMYAARKGTDSFIDYAFKIYKGTLHGFAIRPDLTKPLVKEAYEAALVDAISWFNKTLVV
ncbi:Protein AIM2 [Termitomyces sp. J132]|nr:hypothetical protein H2248_012477 [Termitomyces sp. 'cryptogamus']KNZ72454.1 Protein AIM2 [Termitomyces sp. J132]